MNPLVVSCLYYWRKNIHHLVDPVKVLHQNIGAVPTPKLLDTIWNGEAVDPGIDITEVDGPVVSGPELADILMIVRLACHVGSSG